MLEIWNVLRGKKTYLASLACMLTAAGKAIGDYGQGLPVDWNALLQQVLTCVATMALRHGIANGK